MISKDLQSYLISTNQPECLEYLEGIQSLIKVDWPCLSFNAILLEEVFAFLNFSPELKLFLKDSLVLLKDFSFVEEILNISRVILQNSQGINQNKWPKISLAKHPMGSALEIYTLLFNIPLMLERYQALKIPQKYATDLLQDLNIWIEDFYKKNGRYGLSELGWLCNHFNLKIFQIGRLQFEPRINPLPYYGFQNNSTKQVLILVKNDQKIRKDGLFNGTNDTTEEDLFTTEYVVDSQNVCGAAVDPSGVILKEQKTLSLAKWKPILSPESTVLSLHIPASGALKKELIDGSLEDAKVFFRLYFPQIIFECFITVTWFMDPAIEKYLPNSNIVSFQKAVYLLPVPKANNIQFNERVFGVKEIDINTFDAQTSLQKAGIEHMRKGGKWKNFGFVLFKEDVPLLEGLYREQFNKR